MKLITTDMKKEIGERLVDVLKKNMNKISYGRIYKIKGKIHIASKKGDPPNNLTGALNKSLRYKLHGNDTIEIGGGYEDKVKYLKYLEADRLQRFNVRTLIEKEKRFIERVLNKSVINYFRVFNHD